MCSTPTVSLSPCSTCLYAVCTLQVVSGVLGLEQELFEVRRLEDWLHLREDDVLLGPLHAVHEYLKKVNCMNLTKLEQYNKQT